MAVCKRMFTVQQNYPCAKLFNADFYCVTEYNISIIYLPAKKVHVIMLVKNINLTRDIDR